MHIRVDDLSGQEVQALLHFHLQSLRPLSPIESQHALNLEGLKKPEVTFWTAWDAGELLGCGALMELTPDHGEIKSMRTAVKHLRKGVARALLTHIVEEAKLRAYRRVSLETGSASAFAPAQRLYESFGFTYCSPFADYVEDPHSVFMTLEL